MGDVYKSRKWLNPVGHADTGAISSKVHVSENWVDAFLSIWDCGRKVTLSFDFDDEKTAKQRAEKIDILLQEIISMKAAMGEAYLLMQEWPVNEEIENEV